MTCWQPILKKNRTSDLCAAASNAVLTSLYKRKEMQERVVESYERIRGRKQEALRMDKLRGVQIRPEVYLYLNAVRAVRIFAFRSFSVPPGLFAKLPFFLKVCNQVERAEARLDHRCFLLS